MADMFRVLGDAALRFGEATAAQICTVLDEETAAVQALDVETSVVDDTPPPMGCVSE